MENLEKNLKGNIVVAKSSSSCCILIVKYRRDINGKPVKWDFEIIGNEKWIGK